MKNCLFFFSSCINSFIRETQKPLTTRAATSNCRQVERHHMKCLISHILKSNELQGTVIYRCSSSVHCLQKQHGLIRCCRSILTHSICLLWSNHPSPSLYRPAQHPSSAGNTENKTFANQFTLKIYVSYLFILLTYVYL